MGRRGGVVRLEKAGAVDPTFQPGKSRLGVVVSALTLPDGKIFVAGDFEYYNGVYAPGFVILEPDGRVPARKVEWVAWPKSAGGNGHFYGLTERAESWQEAAIEAQRLGRHLVEIRDAKKQAFLERTILQGEIMLRPAA